MGYNTVMMWSNDGFDQIEKDKDIVRKCITASYRGGTVSAGYHTNPIKVMKTRHADDACVYVHMGNTLVEMNPYSDETRTLMERHPDFFNELIEKMNSDLTELKKMSKKS